MSKLAVAVAVLAGMGLVSIQPACADGSGTYVSGRRLPPARWHQSPLEFQIVNTAPRVLDTRNPVDETVYEFQIPDMPASRTNTVRVGVGGAGTSPGGAAGAGASAPQTIRISGNRPPAARFGSNITPASTSRLNSLPGGQSTNLLGNKQVAGSIKPGDAHSKPPAASARPVALAPVGPQALKHYAPYQKQGGSATGSGSRSTSTSVSGEVKRYSLLGRSN